MSVTTTTATAACRAAATIASPINASNHTIAVAAFSSAASPISHLAIAPRSAFTFARVRLAFSLTFASAWLWLVASVRKGLPLARCWLTASSFSLVVASDQLRLVAPSFAIAFAQLCGSPSA